MKHLLALVALFSTTAFAGDWDKSQHNFNMDGEHFGVQIRQEFNSTKDHIQLTVKPVKDLSVDFRYVEDIEKRYRISYNFKSDSGLYFKPRLEYRDLDAGGNYFRVRPIVGFNTKGDTSFYGYFQPTYNLDKTGQSAFHFDATQTEIGVKQKLTDTVSFGPFIQYNTDNNWKKTDLFLGTNLTVKF